MNLTLHFGWWIIPAVLTVASYIFLKIKNPPRIRGDYDFGLDILLVYGAWIVFVLLVWCIFFAVMFFLK